MSQVLWLPKERYREVQGKQAQVLQLLRSPILIGGDSAYVHRPRLSFAGEDSGDRTRSLKGPPRSTGVAL